MKTLTLNDLYCDTVDVEPRDFNFGQGYAETWDTIYPDVSEWDKAKCRQWCEDNGYDFTGFDDIEEQRDEVQEYMRESEQYSPMMNYIYPLPDLKHSPSKAQELIDDTNCVIVLIKDDRDDYCETPYLALSGGGMDLSWDICEAYMLLGYLPPVHFCHLPQLAGKKLTETAQWIINGCKKSCEVSKNWANSRINDLDHLEQNMNQ